MAREFENAYYKEIDETFGRATSSFEKEQIMAMTFKIIFNNGAVISGTANDILQTQYMIRLKEVHYGKPEVYKFFIDYDKTDLSEMTINGELFYPKDTTRLCYPRHNSKSMMTCETYLRNEIMYDTYFRRKNKIVPSIKKVIFNSPATIIFWADNTKTVVKCGELDAYDPEKGMAMAIAKKAMGNKGHYFDEFKKWVPEKKQNKNCSTCVHLGSALNDEPCRSCIKTEDHPDYEDLKTSTLLRWKDDGKEKADD